MERIKCRLISIETNQKKVMQDLRECFEEKVKETAQKLYAHLSSREVITRFSSWTEDKVPVVEDSWEKTETGIKRALQSRLNKVVESWEEKNNVLGSARKCLIESFEKHYLEVTSQLRDVEGVIMDEDGSLASPNNDILRSNFSTTLIAHFASVVSLYGFAFAGTAYAPVYFLGLSLVPTLIFYGKLAGYLRCWKYQTNKASFMKGPSEKFLQGAADPENLKIFVRGKLKEVEIYLNNMMESLPKLIEADKELCKQLAGDERSQAEKEKLYKPIFDESLQQRSQLAIFGITEVCSTSICREDVKWNEDGSSRIGSGSFATVYKANLRRHGEDQIVALKVFHKELCKENAIAITEEIYLLRKLDHHHIVRFYGVVKDKASARVISVLEKCEENLKSRIFKNQESIPSRSGNPDVPKDVCRWAKEICDGLVYIHGQQIVHRDLKLENILVSRDNSVRIADVGLAKAVDDITGTVAGTYVYMAPEVLHGRAYGSKADIYSLGIMLWEMWYGKRAFHDMHMAITPLEQFCNSVDDGCRPEHLEGCEKLPIRWKSVVTQCWEGNPESRPTAAVCATKMRMQQMELDEAVCSISIGYKELEWKEDASSSFPDGVVDVFQGIRKRKDGFQTDVTLKLCREGFEAIKAKETVTLMKQLRSLKHDRIVGFFGVSLCMGKEITVETLVLEKCTESLRNYMSHRHPQAQADKQAAWKWAKEITEGLAYIHDQGIIHGQLKLENIWVSEKKSAKIAVTGMDKVAKDIIGAFAENPIYMAPEVLRGEEYDNKADIYSMGLMFWEMSYGRVVSWEIPANLKREEVLRKVENGYRPEFLDKEPYKAPLSQWIQLMKECWDKDPKSRPTAKECRKRIKKVESCHYGGEQSQ